MLIAIVAVGATGCFIPNPAPDDPFAESLRPRQGMRDYQVVFEVVCQDCTIRWSVGSNQRVENTRRSDVLWRRSISHYAQQATRLRLTAQKDSDQPVQSVRIFVDGDLVAEQLGEASDNYRREAPTATGGLTVEAVIGR